MDEYDDTIICVITRRSRGVYLAHYNTSRDGLEEWDAFATLAAAKRWCARIAGRKRLPWEDARQPGRWIAEVAE